MRMSFNEARAFLLGKTDPYALDLNRRTLMLQ